MFILNRHLKKSSRRDPLHIEILSLTVMKLLLRYVYNQKIENGNFTIGYTIQLENSKTKEYILSQASNLRNANGEFQPSLGLYTTLVNLMLIQAEKYEDLDIYVESCL